MTIQTAIVSRGGYGTFVEHATRLKTWLSTSQTATYAPSAKQNTTPSTQSNNPANQTGENDHEKNNRN